MNELLGYVLIIAMLLFLLWILSPLITYIGPAYLFWGIVAGDAVWFTLAGFYGRS